MYDGTIISHKLSGRTFRDLHQISKLRQLVTTLRQRCVDLDNTIFHCTVLCHCCLPLYFYACVFLLGVYGTEIHFLEIKFYDLALYVEVEKVNDHLQSWKGKHQGALLAEDSGFFKDVCNGNFSMLGKEICQQGPCMQSMIIPTNIFFSPI